MADLNGGDQGSAAPDLTNLVTVLDLMNQNLSAIGLAVGSASSGGGGGFVRGPASSTNNAFAKWNGTSGTLLEDNGTSIINAELAAMPTLTIKGNNTGVLASPLDLTATQVKALLNYTTAQILPGWVHVADFDAVPDGVMVNNGDGSIVNGSGDFSSASTTFTSDNFGNTICIPGAGAAGGLYVGTITGLGVNAHHVTVTPVASTTVTTANFQYGTDNTTFINDAIAAVTSGGVVAFASGYYLVTSVNATALVNVVLFGAGIGIDNVTSAQVGTVLVAINGNRAILDLVASNGAKVINIQRHHFLSPVTALTGTLCAPSLTQACSSIVCEDAGSYGSFSACPDYWYGVGDSMIVRGKYRNVTGTNAVLVFTRDNTFGITSAYQSIATAHTGVGNIDIYGAELHDQNAAGTATTGTDILMRGAVGIRLWGCILDCANATTGNVTAVTVDATDCTIQAIGTTFYTETPGHKPKYNYYSTDTLTIAGFNNPYTNITSRTGGGGTFNYVSTDS